MYKKTLVIVTVLVCATFLAAVYLNGQAHRYDIVAVGAGGGSNADQGNVEVGTWLVDHKTGEIWAIKGVHGVVPIPRIGDDGNEIKK